MTPIDLASKSKWPVSEGLVLAGLPVLGTVVAFFYDAGKLDFFQLPLDFADVSIDRIVIATLFLIMPIAIGYIMYGFGFAPYIGGRQPPKPSSRANFILSIAGVGILIVLYLAGMTLLSWLVSFGGILTFIVVMKLLQALRDSAEDGRAEIAPAGPTDLRRRETLPLPRARVRAKLTLLGFLVVVLTLASSWATGYWNASEIKSVLVLEEAPDYLMVRRIGELFVLKRYDPATTTLLPDMALLKVDKSLVRVRKVKLSAPMSSPGRNVPWFKSADEFHPAPGSVRSQSTSSPRDNSGAHPSNPSK